eukprot:8739816-Pyramimonas_sp.AAC.1
MDNRIQDRLPEDVAQSRLGNIIQLVREVQMIKCRKSNDKCSSQQYMWEVLSTNSLSIISFFLEERGQSASFPVLSTL